MTRTITAADLFCGAGGTSTGLLRAAERGGYRVNLLAVNHWSVAIATHSANHPGSEHLCESLDAVSPRKVVPGGCLDILVASPECIHHSKARGGRPMNDQSRASAWHVLRWAEALDVKHILIENVEEFRDWGALDGEGRPIKSKKGATFRAFLTSLRSLGYKVAHQVVNCADYGDPTTRRRLFIMASKGRLPRFPQPTHSKDASLFGAEPWTAAREIIDWSLPAPSIFSRKRPLSDNTLRRIAAGLRKFCGLPFVLTTEHAGQGHERRSYSIDEPMRTITGQDSWYLANPFLVTLNGTAPDQLDRCVRSVDDPAPTIVGSGNHVYLAQPFVLGQQSGAAPRSVDQPLPTIATDGAISLVQPFLVEYHGGKRWDRSRSLDDPLPTQDTSNRFGLCRPFIVPCNHGRDDRAHSVDEPMRTITSVDAWGLAQPFLVNYTGTGTAHSVQEPLDTVTATDRFGLAVPIPVQLPDGQQALLDIGFRMLQPHELAAAMSFPADYRFEGTREQRVKQIGNAVPCRTAEALCGALLA